MVSWAMHRLVYLGALSSFDHKFTTSFCSWALKFFPLFHGNPMHKMSKIYIIRLNFDVYTMMIYHIHNVQNIPI